MQDKNITLAEQIAEKVNNKGGKVYYVGGYVRDKILGLPNKDIDIEVHNIDVKDLKDILISFGKVKLVGESFGVFNLGGYNLDIALPRAEVPTGTKHTDFEITVDPFIGVEKAAERRDFTINAIMQNVLTGEIVDPFHGQEDILQHQIRHVNEKAFTDDALRVLRAAQFAARFNFEINGQTKDLMRHVTLQHLPRERIYAELEKALLKGKSPSTFFRALAECHQLDIWFPELTGHNETLEQVCNSVDIAKQYADIAQEKRNFMMTALLYPAYQNTQNIASVQMFLRRMNPDVSIKKYTLNIIPKAEELLSAFRNSATDQECNILFDTSYCPQDLVLFTKQICLASCPEKVQEFDLWGKQKIHAFKQLKTTPEVMGKDLIQLGLTPGKQFGEILKKAHQDYLAGKTKEEIIYQIREDIR